MAKVIQLTDSSGDCFPKLQYEYNTYTPTITWSGEPTSNLTVANVSFRYIYSGETLYVSGRFQVTNAGTPTQTLHIDLPSGFTTGSLGVINVGFLIKPDMTLFPVRKDSGAYFNILGSTDGRNITTFSTGYYLFEANLFGARRS